MLTHFYHLWPLGQKGVIQIFDKLSGCKIIKQNVPWVLLVILTLCICIILKLLLKLVNFFNQPSFFAVPPAILKVMS